MSTRSPVAFCGAGLIGGGMVQAALARGETVHVWNRTKSKADALSQLGAKSFETPAECVRGADRVHLVLSDDAAVESVLSACGDALPALVVDHSTTRPDLTAARAARFTAENKRYLHAPVFMSPAMAKEAKGLILTAGARATFEAAEPHLKTMTGEVWYIGERADLAAAYKLFGNAMIISITNGVADTLTLARSMDLKPEDVLALFARFQVGRTLEVRGVNMAKGNFAPSFELTMARKDARLMIESAARKQLSLPGIESFASRADEMIARGQGAMDMGVIAMDAVSAK